MDYSQKGDDDADWQLQEAKAQFSEVVRRAQKQPQHVSLRGKDAVVVVSADFFKQLLPESGKNLAELMGSSPLGDLEFDDVRQVMPVREVDL